MAKYVISHVGKKGTQVAHETIEARTKAIALEVYLKYYSKQWAENCTVVKTDKDAQVTLPRPRKAKAEKPKKAKTAKTGTTEYGAKAKANAQAKADEGHPELFEAEIKAVNKLKGKGFYFEGTWMWVTGVTADEKDIHAKLKAMGFGFSGKRQAWRKVGKQVETPAPAPAPAEEPKVTQVKARKTRKAKAEEVKAEEPTKAIASKNAKASKARKAESAKAKVKAPKKIA